MGWGKLALIVPQSLPISTDGYFLQVAQTKASEPTWALLLPSSSQPPGNHAGSTSEVNTDSQHCSPTATDACAKPPSPVGLQWLLTACYLYASPF